MHHDIMCRGHRALAHVLRHDEVIVPETERARTHNTLGVKVRLGMDAECSSQPQHLIMIHIGITHPHSSEGETVNIEGTQASCFISLHMAQCDCTVRFI